MDASKLIEFLGHTSIHPPLDDFLIQCGIKKRPKSYETRNLELNNFDIKIGFIDNIEFADEYLTKQKSEGLWVLSSIVIYKNFSGDLPFGISMQMGYDQLIGILGKQLKIQVAGMTKETREQPSFYYSNIYIAAGFEKNSTKLDFIKFKFPDIYNKEHYNLQIV